MRGRKIPKNPVEAAREDERRRIASELHDRVLQGLASVALRLEATRTHLLRTEAAAQEDLQISEEGVRSAIREIRGVLTSGEHSKWHVGSLIEKIGTEVRSIEQNHALQISLELQPPDAVVRDLRMEYDVFQVTREALRNVVRHAQASAARLRITLTTDSLQVTVSDNGKGFDTTTDSPLSGSSDKRTGTYGLRSMRHRIERLGGAMSIRSAPGQGATIRFDIPLNPTRASQQGADGPRPAD